MGARNILLVVILAVLVTCSVSSWALAQTQIIHAPVRKCVFASAAESGSGTTHEPEAEEHGAKEHGKAEHGTAEREEEHEAAPTGGLLSFSDILFLGVIVAMLIVIGKGLGRWGAKREAKS
ncbi:MAG: hypothetical protein AB1466_01175 [Actinomycetota bacterium]